MYLAMIQVIFIIGLFAYHALDIATSFSNYRLIKSSVKIFVAGEKIVVT